MQPKRFVGIGLQDLGYIPDKRDGVNRGFDTLNYSFIISGEGTVYLDGEPQRIETPCVITQLPGKRAQYEPGKGGWEELYIILNPEQMVEMDRKGYFDRQPGYWRIENGDRFMRVVREFILEAKGRGADRGHADRMDHFGERLIKESLLSGEQKVEAEGSEHIWGLAKQMETHPETMIDFAQWAKKRGISYSTFQRRWGSCFDEAPGHYQLKVRLTECCRLLAETDQKILHIGISLGFEDPAYFSRIFRSRIGMSPTDFRNIHRLG